MPSEKEPNAEKRKITERARAWKELMSPSGGLSEFQNTILNEIKDELADRNGLKKKFEAFTQSTAINISPVGPTNMYPNDIEQAASVRENKFKHTVLGFGNHSPVWYNPDAQLSPEQTALLRAIGFYALLSKLHAKQLEARTREKPLHTGYERTDLHHPTEIIADNVQTLLDVIRVAVRDTKSIPEQLSVIERLVRERPEYNYTNDDNRVCTLNSNNNTNLELCARAPFGFWASLRYAEPMHIDGEPVVNTQEPRKPLFSSAFVHLLTQAKLEKGIDGQNLTRHGGCPALHSDIPQRYDLINTLGERFLELYKVLLEEELLATS